jgi:peroxiredoxin
MKRKHRNQTNKSQKNTTPRSVVSPFRPIVLVVLCLSLVLNIFFIWQHFRAPNSHEMLTHAASKAAFGISSPMVLRDAENPSYRIRVGDLWDQKLQRTSGYVAHFPLSNFPDVAIIVDPDVRIVSLGLTSSLRLMGSTMNLQPYFSRFSGLGLEALAGNTGIFKSDEANLTRFSEHFKDALLKTMQMLFIKAKGSAEFNRLYPNGIHLAASGDRLRTFQAVDTKGNSLGLKDLQQQKTAIITVDTNCGACEIKSSVIRDLAEDYGISVIFVTTGDQVETDRFISKYVRNERVIMDTDRSLARLLYLGDPPALMLIDRDLVIIHKGYVGDVAKDAEPYFKLFK